MIASVPAHHRPEGDRDLLPQAAVEAHVLLVVHRVDHRARAQEQQRLEEGVREQVEHRRAERADARGEEHVAELRAGRIGDHALDVGLRRADVAAKKQVAAPTMVTTVIAVGLVTNIGDRRQTMNTPAVTIVAAWISAETGRRAFHRVGQPGVQAELRRLAHRADEQQQAQHGHRIDAARRGSRSSIRPCAGAAARIAGIETVPNTRKVPKMPSEKPKSPTRLTTNALIAALLARRLVVPEADQQVRGEADAFPAEEHLDQAVRRHQHQHREGEQREIGEEARLVRVLRHIAPAIQVDERRDAGDHHQHHRGQAVDAQRPVDVAARPNG